MKQKLLFMLIWFYDYFLYIFFSFSLFQLSCIHHHSSIDIIIICTSTHMFHFSVPFIQIFIHTNMNWHMKNELKKSIRRWKKYLNYEFEWIRMHCNTKFESKHVFHRNDNTTVWCHASKSSECRNDTKSNATHIISISK
jgi:hypothetical protein